MRHVIRSSPIERWSLARPRPASTAAEIPVVAIFCEQGRYQDEALESSR